MHHQLLEDPILVQNLAGRTPVTVERGSGATDMRRSPASILHEVQNTLHRGIDERINACLIGVDDGKAKKLQFRHISNQVVLGEFVGNITYVGFWPQASI